MPAPVGCLCGLLLCIFLSNLQVTSGHPLFRQVPGLQSQAQDARACVANWLGEPGAAPKDHLAAVYLHSHARDSHRNALLVCSIRNLVLHVGTMTPLHIYVFVMTPAYSAMKRLLTSALREHAVRVCVLAVPWQQWRFHPRLFSYMQEGNSRHAGSEYFRMGLWRMLVPYNIMSVLGYPYFLQVDDDLMVTQPFPFNIVQEMRNKNYTVMSHRMPVEHWSIMYGLPELASFYLKSNDLQPGGSLLQHVTPPSMAGVFSPRTNWWESATHPKEGYDLTYLYGNFLAMSTQLWSDTRVQDWLATCILSGGLERHRWQEQGVVSFVWLLFTDPHNLWFVGRQELRWLHTRDVPRLTAVCPNLLDD